MAKQHLGFDQKLISDAKRKANVLLSQRPKVQLAQGVNGGLFYFGAGEFRESVYWSAETRLLTRDQVKFWLGARPYDYADLRVAFAEKQYEELYGENSARTH